MSFYQQHYNMQIAGETFDIIQSDVLQGSKVVLDVEEEGLDKRSILSLDAATEISSSGITCFRSSDGKEHCFADAEPGECNSFGGPEERRKLGWFKKLKKKVDSALDTAKQAAQTALDKTTATVNQYADNAKTHVVSAADKVTATSKIDSLNMAIVLGPVYQASVTVTNNAMKQANVAPAALAGIEAGARMAAGGLEEGVYTVEKAGVYAANWLDAMQCELGMNILLGTLFALKLVDPLPVGVATATAYLTGVAIAYKAAPFSTEKAVLGGACDLAAEHFLENIWSSTSVVSAVGEHNKEALLDAIAMTVCKTLKRVPDAFVSGFSGAAIVAGVTVNSATELACRKRVPRATAAWGDLKVYGYSGRKWINLRNGAYSWKFAQHTCNSIYDPQVLCPRSLVCPNGPLQQPREGMRTFDSWVPIGGEGENKWINIGNQNSATELCKDRYELGYGDPSWGVHTQKNVDTPVPFKNVIYCCREHDAATFEDPPPNTPTIAPTTLKPTTLKWHFAPFGPHCDYGSPAPKDQCEAAVAALAIAAGRSPSATGSLQVGSNKGNCGNSGWNAVPRGCSAQTGGSWVAHYKTSGGNCNEGKKYQLVCG